MEVEISSKHRFLNDLKLKMKTNYIRYTTTNKNKVSKVAVCGGIGVSLKHAIKEKSRYLYSSILNTMIFLKEKMILLLRISGIMKVNNSQRN